MSIIYPLAFIGLSLIVMAALALFPLFFSGRDLDEANGHEEDEQ